MGCGQNMILMKMTGTSSSSHRLSEISVAGHTSCFDPGNLYCCLIAFF